MDEQGKAKGTDRGASPSGDEGGRAQREPSPGALDLEPLREPVAVGWRWVGVSAALIAGLHALMVFAIAPALFGRGVFASILLGVVPYIVGGGVLGAVSKEKTLLEPFYAACLPALIFPFVAEFLRASATDPVDVGALMGAMEWLAAIAPVIGYILVAMFSCWVVERRPWRPDSAL